MFQISFEGTIKMILKIGGGGGGFILLLYFWEKWVL
jgi:hypothetical protein